MNRVIELHPKYYIDDIVYFISSGKIREGKVCTIKINTTVSSSGKHLTICEYKVWKTQEHMFATHLFNEDQLFASKEELINSLL